MKQLILVIVTLVCTLEMVSAQQRTLVTGKVTDAATGEELIGVNVARKGSSAGTITDMDGNYTLEAVNLQTDILVFSYVGYVTTEIPVQGHRKIDATERGNQATYGAGRSGLWRSEKRIGGRVYFDH